MVSTAYDLATAYDLSRRELAFCNAKDPVRRVAREFYIRGIGSMIVVSGKEHIGFVTDCAIFRALSEGADLLKAKVEDLKLDPLITVRRDAPLSEVASLFDGSEASRIAVIDDEGKVVGVVKRKNLDLLDRFRIVDRVLDRTRS